jgi:YD repeat-containing protein
MMTVRTFHVIRYSNKGKKNLLPRKELYSTWTSHFNEQGQLILYEKIFNHNEWEIIRYQYDEQGKTSKEEHYHKGPRDSVERLQAIYEYEYKYYMR